MTPSTSNWRELNSHLMPVSLIGDLVQRIAPFPVYVVNTSYKNWGDSCCNQHSFAPNIDLGGVTRYFDMEDEAVEYAYRKAKGKQRDYLRNCRGLRAVENLISDIAVYAESRHITLPTLPNWSPM